jgi:hypothetical protein
MSDLPRFPPVEHGKQLYTVSTAAQAFVTDSSAGQQLFFNKVPRGAGDFYHTNLRPVFYVEFWSRRMQLRQLR